MSPARSPVPAIPADLAASIRARKVHLFVGSGVSASAGMLGWQDLIGEMANGIKKENTAHSAKELDEFLSRADYIDIAELFRETVGLSAYLRFLRERYRRDAPVSPLLKAIAKLEVRIVFTTNYDKLLETAFRRNAKIDPPVIIYPTQLNYIEEEETRIIKVHGDIDHPSSIVLTRKDYAEYGSRHAEFVSMLQSSINGYTMLFVGFGLRDPNLQRIYSDARNLFESTNRQAYALMTGTNAVERALWHDDGLTILPLSSHRQVVQFITQLQLVQ
jgi:hypothetical protein